VDDALLDATGTPLQGGAVRGFLVGDDERRIVDPRTWEVSRPGVGSREPVVVEFHRPLDHGLLSRCLRVVDARGHRIRGIGTVGAEEGSWRFAPEQPWADRGHELLIDPRLEDLAGNSLVRVFDRDLSELTHHPEVSVDDGVVVGFRPGPDRAQ
jgi:hypothetical protein